MPVLRYFLFVGGALLALLFGTAMLVPQTELPRVVAASNADMPPIRIRSDRKLPERVVFDTAQPVVAPSVVAAAQPEAPVAPQLDKAAAARDSYAELVTPEAKPAAARTPVKKAEAREARPAKRRVARSRSYGPSPYDRYGYANRPMVVAQQPHFGWFGNTW